MTGNDQIAFYSAVPGYYPPTGSQSPVSLVAYRVNSDSTSSSYNKMERMGKGLVWNGVSLTTCRLFSCHLTIAIPCRLGRLRRAVRHLTASYEVIGPQVFRFEYAYLLRANGSLSITPPADISGIAAIIVDIAVIDPKSKVLLTNAQIATLAGQLPDYAANIGMTPASCVLTGRTRSTRIRLCRARRFPVFGCTNAFFIFRRLLYDYFAF